MRNLSEPTVSAGTRNFGRRMARKGSLGALALFSVLFAQNVVDAPSGATLRPMDEIPSFVAQGTLSDPNTSSSNHFTFEYNNGWWQVALTNANPGTGGPILQNCRRIPDGVRYYFLFSNSNGGLPTATACPSAFPPPGIAGGMFECWLALCPYAQLPLIDDRRLQRFLNIPTCQPQLENDPRSFGDYHLDHLRPQGAFLSSISVTNNGYWLDLNRNAEFAFHPYGPPFEHGGFPELTYEAVQTTNIDGIAFPARAIFKRSTPSYSSKDRQDPLNTYVLELVVTDVRLREGGSEAKHAPPVTFAMDYRSPDLSSSGSSVKYLGTTVTNDKWNAVTPQDGTLRVFPTAEKLGPKWSRELLLLFDPISSPAEDVPRSEAFPESIVQSIQRYVTTNWQGPVLKWGQARFHVRSGSMDHLYEAQVLTFDSRAHLRKEFADLVQNIRPKNGQGQPVQGVGEAAMLFGSSDRQKMTLWFIDREHLVSISPLGPGPHLSWEGDLSLRHLANAIALNSL